MGRQATTALAVLAVVTAAGAVLWGGATRVPATLALGFAGAATLLLAARSGRELRWSPLAVPPLAMAALAMLQLVPLSPSIRGAISPASTRMIALVFPGEPPGWHPLTNDVSATLCDAAKLLGIGAIAIGWQVLGPRDRAWLRAVVLSALGALLLGPALALLGLWHPASTRLVSFSLINPNHAAALLAMVLPLVLAMALEASGRSRWLLLALAVTGNVALAATLSRAGIAIGLAAQTVVLVRMFREQRRLAVGLSAAIVLVLAVFAGPLREKLESASHRVPASFGRLAVARDALGMIADHRWAGAGRGAFELVFDRYADASGRLRFGFVENEYLQLFTDFGIPGGLLVLVVVVIALRRALPELRGARSRTLAAAVGLCALALHNCVDFSWEAGAVALAACALGALAFPSAGAPIKRWAAVTIAMASILVGGVALSRLGRTFEQDGNALRAAYGLPRQEFADRAEAAFRRHPSDGHLADLAAERMLAEHDPASARWIDRALLLGPRDPIAHRLAARLLRQTGHREQAALELGLASANTDDRLRALVCAEAVGLFSADAESVASTLAPDPLLASCLLQDLANKQRWTEVETVARAALDVRPDDPIALHALAQAASARDEKATAADAALRLVALDPSPSAALVGAEALRRAERSQDAERVLAEAWSRAPHEVELPAALANLLAVRGDFDHARRTLDDAIAAAVDQVEKARLHDYLAEIEERAGHSNRAAAERAEAQRLRR